MEDCNCIKEVKEKVIDYMTNKKTNPKGFKIIETRWEHSTIYPKQRLYVNHIIQSTFTKVDGTESKPRNDTVAIHFTYCPFCGNKYDKEETT